MQRQHAHTLTPPEHRAQPSRLAQQRPSWTAQATALMRSLAGTDHLAVQMLRPPVWLAWWLLARLSRVGLSLDRLLFGFASAVAARQVYLDTALGAACRSGARQVVILGAGYDTRPWRLRCLDGARLFVVDHPATAAHRAAQVGGLLPPRGIRVDVDFRRGDLAARLRAAGFCGQQPTAWVWEGVSMYLCPGAVRRTLCQLSALSAPGSRLLFDAWNADACGQRPLYERLRLAVLQRTGEPIRAAFSPRGVAALSARCGWEAVDVTTTAGVAGFPGASGAMLLVEARKAQG